jgi:hypothetical protein
LAAPLPATTTKVLATSAESLATKLLATEVELELLSRNTWNDEALSTEKIID